MAIDDLTEISSSIAQGTLPWQPIFIVAERRRLVALPGGLMLGSALHLVFHFCIVRRRYQLRRPAYTDIQLSPCCDWCFTASAPLFHRFVEDRRMIHCESKTTKHHIPVRNFSKY